MAEAGLDAEVADILAGMAAKPANIPEISVEKVSHSPGSRRAKAMGTPTFDRDTPVLPLTSLRGSPASEPRRSSDLLAPPETRMLLLGRRGSQLRRTSIIPCITVEGSGGEENFLNKYDSKGSPKLSHRSKSETKLYEDDSDRSKLSKKESLKEQKKNYRREKKRAAKELLNTLKDPSVVVLRDWLKIRGTLKGWQKYWCVLKPGVLIIYKGPKHGAWVGTILLNACEIIERPSKMNGFCFKVFHPLDQSIWASKGPKGETVPAITQPLPTSYLILRAATDADGRCWMDAMELSLRCSSLLMRSMVKDTSATNGQQSMSTLDTSDPNQGSRTLWDEIVSASGDDLIFPSSWNESDIERHFQVHLALGRTITTQNGEEEEKEEKEEEKDEDEKESKGSDSEASEQHDQVFEEDLEPPKETVYRENTCEELGQQGGASQTEEVADENKSIIWTLIKQVRPGMDLSRVVLPTFILEPRSFLDKLSDYYYHADLLSDAVNIDDPFGRMKQIVRWYLSGFYKKPKGLKKPYNPILGETFRCMWPHPQTGSKTFFIAEQVSHHPPVSAFYVTNRQDGFCINGSILCKSKFYGNSLSAILDGTACLTLLNRGEDYAITMPYVSCKGILYGTMTMEMGGKVSLTCDKTGYRTEIEFKLKPFLGGSDASNQITGKIKLGKETLATLEGHWDQDVFITDKRADSEKTEVFWSVTDEVKSRRLKRQTVRFEDQGDFESEKLWQHVSAAISACDQNKATNEKYILEEQQRKDARERKDKRADWIPKLFEREGAEEHDWIYKHIDTRPWDPHNDVFQYEFGGVVQAKTRHKTPMVRTTSIMSVPGTQRQQSLKNRKHLGKPPGPPHRDSDRSSSEPRPDEDDASDDERSDVSSRADTGRGPRTRHYTSATIEQAVRPLVRVQQETNDRLADLSGRLRMLANQNAEHSNYLQNKDWLLLAVVMLFQVVTMYMFSR